MEYNKCSHYDDHDYISLMHVCPITSKTDVHAFTFTFTYAAVLASPATPGITKGVRDLQILGRGAECVFARKKSLSLFDHIFVYFLFIYSYLILAICCILCIDDLI